MVYEARPGQTFLLGASTWRIEEITRDRVIVTPAPGRARRRAVLEGRRHRPPEGARPRDRRVRARVGRPRARRSWPPSTTSTSAPRATCPPSCASSATPRAWCRATARSSWSASATRSATGACACCRPSAGACTPPGRSRCRRASATSSGSSPTPSGRTTGSSSTSPTPTSRPPPTCSWSSRTRSRTWWCASCPSSALFGARFRENAARALLLPRAYPGKRTPLWQQRLKAQSLLEVAKRYGQFPIVLETYRECLQDVLDLPGLQQLLRGLHTRELSLVEVETQRAVPVRLVAPVRLRGHLHVRGRHAQRRAARRRAVARPRPAARAARPGGAARADRPGRARGGRGRPSADQRAHARRERGRRCTTCCARWATSPPTRRRRAACRRWRAARILGELEKERRAVRMRIGGEERWIASEDAGLYRDALGAVPPGGLPAVFLEEVEEPLTRLGAPLRAHARPVHHARDLGPLRARLRAGAARARARRRTSCAASCGPGGSEREWCDPEVLRRLRRASLATLRKEVEPAEQRALARFLPEWQGVDGAPPGGAGVDRLREMLVPLQGLALAPEVWERDVLPAPRGRLLARLAGPALRERRARLGGRRSARPQLRPGGAAVPRGRPLARPAALQGRAALGAAPRRDPRAARARRRVLDRPARRPRRGRAGRAPGGALGPRLGRARSRTTPSRRCARRSCRSRRATARRAAASRAAAVRARRRCRAAGRSPRRCSPARPRTARACARSPSCCSSATGSSRARPCWRRASPAASPGSTRSWPTSRRSARRGAATSSRASAARSSRCRPRSSGCAACAPTSPPGRWCWPPPTRPTRTARRCRGRSARTTTPAAGPPRVPGAYVVTLDAEPVLYVERGGKGLLALREPRRGVAAPGARGARRRGPPRPRAAPRHRALRRRAGGGLRGGRAPDRARLPPEPAPPHAERLTPRGQACPKSGDSPRFLASSRGVASIAQCRATSSTDISPAHAQASSAELIARLRAAAEELTAEGTAVRHVRSSFLPADELFLHLIEAESAEAAGEATQTRGHSAGAHRRGRVRAMTTQEEGAA